MARFSWSNKVVVLTGGTGSFGRAFVDHMLKKRKPPVIRIFSRDEFKQHLMQQEYVKYSKYLRFLLGDVRDKDRLKRAINGADVVVHAAALKQIPLGEYNPFEPIQTNILGTRNVVEAVLDVKVKRALLISSDKAAYPINLYGATKLCAEKLFVQGNSYVGKSTGMFSVVRYGNVLGSRGSVVPHFFKQRALGKLDLTHKEMTRFWITLPEASKLVEMCLAKMKGGEIFVPRLPSVKLVDLAKAIAPKARLNFVGIRPGEKLHEVLVTEEESSRLEKHANYFVIKPQFPFWQGSQLKKRGRPPKRLLYRSDSNDNWLSSSKLARYLRILEH